MRAETSDRVQKKKSSETQALSVRMPTDMHEALKVLSYATDRSINDLVLRAVGNFLADEGHREAVDAFAAKAQKQYRVAFDKLKDM